MKNIFFDLDGTLLALDAEEFTREYFNKISEKTKCAEKGKYLTKSIWDSTTSVVENKDKEKTNEQCFLEAFREKIDNVDEAMEMLEDFYRNEFTELKSLAKSNKIAKKSVELLKQKGYTLVVATNPLFPKKVIIERIRWADLCPDDFKFITSYENMHYCKPHLEYYEEILEHIGGNAEETMMVGNDVQEDIVSGKLGIKTFLLNDYTIDRKEPSYTPDYVGNFEDLYKLIEKLPNV